MGVQRRGHTAAVRLLVVSALVTAAACGNAVVPVNRPTAAPTSAASPTAAASETPSLTPTPASSSSPSPSQTRPVTPTPNPSTTTAGDRQLRSWPAGMVIPARTTVTSALTDSRGGLVTMTASSRATLLDQLDAQLSVLGMTVEYDTATAFRFRGPGWVGQVAAEGSGVTMRWVVGDAVAARYARDVGLTTGVPALMRYPSGVTPANQRIQPSGSSYDLTGRSPAELLAFYRGDLSPLVTITGDLNENGVTTLTFSDGVYDSVITATDTTFRVVHTRRG